MNISNGFRSYCCAKEIKRPRGPRIGEPRYARGEPGEPGKKQCRPRRTISQVRYRRALPKKPAATVQQSQRFRANLSTRANRIATLSVRLQLIWIDRAPPRCGHGAVLRKQCRPAVGRQRGLKNEIALIAGTPKLTEGAGQMGTAIAPWSATFTQDPIFQVNIHDAIDAGGKLLA